MKIVSWNVNGLRAVYNNGHWEKFIEKLNPDIICLQEIKAKKEQINFIKNYKPYFNSAQKPGYSGTAILSKIKPLKISYNFDPKIININQTFIDQYGDPNNEGRIIAAEYDNFYLISVYTPNAKNDLSRLNLRYQYWDPLFLNYLNHLRKIKPIIVGGDFNVAHQEIDLAHPKSNAGKKGFTDQERQGMTNFIKDGLIDSFRIFNQQPGQYTWWSHFAKSRERNVGWRIDYFLIDNKIKDKIISSTIHPEIFGSDHCPIEIEVNL
jgi:exodeoxyribonuclease-3